VLHQINDCITRMCERHGLPPFDDSLSGQSDNVFRRVKQILFSLAGESRRIPF
jgi:hypothetical protein